MFLCFFITALAAGSPAFKSMPGDSVVVSVHPSYNHVSKFHRWLFGENYRQEWAVPVKLPLIKISEFNGGLTPLKQGGGMQSKSLRLADRSGKEWVIRSVEKSPDMLLPPELRETFARDWLDDALSAQHPFSALAVPPLAEAAHVPHATPVIGVIAPDPALGGFEKEFANTVCLVEEREPAGESDNTIKMLGKLQKDNDNTYDSEMFLRARLLDLLTGDWDRHEDQWRWAKEKKDGNDYYLPVPRDRDQVFRVSEGIFPNLARRRWIAPTLQGFGGKIDDVGYSLFKTRFVNALPASQFSYEKWMDITNSFILSMTDSVLKAGLQRLPLSASRLRYNRLLSELKQRRSNIPAAMDRYYRFINKIADIRTSDKREFAQISDGPGGSLKITIRKISKEGELKDTLMSKEYPPAFTKEVRLYLSDGDDSVTVNAGSSRTKLRIIGGRGEKRYHIVSAGKVKIYGDTDGVRISGNKKGVTAHLSADTLNTAFVPVNLYNVTMPLLTAGINADDGFLLGAGFKHTQQEGFRKVPFANTQEFMVTHSFSTAAFRIKYRGEWTRIAGPANLVVAVSVNAPDNTMNFFGRGNETPFIKEGDFKRYYRARFNTFEANPALRWQNGRGRSFSIGPSFSYYRFDASDNAGRFITHSNLLHSYDSVTVEKDKVHAGLAFSFENDRRDNKLLPSRGSNISLRALGYKGINHYSRSFIRIVPEISVYKSPGKATCLVIADRLGGGITIGKTAFYQSLFLGGQDNLLGYHQYRFAGQHMLYNNLEIRVKISDFASYILPGQFGALAFYDTGRVWEKGEDSQKWHNGTGGGLYFSPAQMTLIRAVAGYSEEGWYPYLALNFRF